MFVFFYFDISNLNSRVLEDNIKGRFVPTRKTNVSVQNIKFTCFVLCFIAQYAIYNLQPQAIQHVLFCNPHFTPEIVYTFLTQQAVDVSWYLVFGTDC
jgi:hypothetical protein